MSFKEELSRFGIDLKTIKPSVKPYDEIKKAFQEMEKNYWLERLEIVLNGNLIHITDTLTKNIVIFGVKVDLAQLEKDISFIVIRKPLKLKKSAQEMFKDLGFKKHSGGNGDWLIYDLEKGSEVTEIVFYKREKECVIKTWNYAELCETFLSFDLVNAIREQLIELGWLDE